MSLEQMTIAVIITLVGLAIGVYILVDTYYGKKREQERAEAEYQKQLELEQALTLDKKFQEDSMVAVKRLETDEILNVSAAEMDEFSVVMTLGAIIDGIIEVSEEDQLKLLVALADSDFEYYGKFVDIVETIYNGIELKEAA